MVFIVGPEIVYDTACVAPDTFAEADPLLPPAHDTGVLEGAELSPQPEVTVKVAVHVLEFAALSVTVKVIV